MATYDLVAVDDAMCGHKYYACQFHALFALKKTRVLNVGMVFIHLQAGIRELCILLCVCCLVSSHVEMHVSLYCVCAYGCVSMHVSLPALCCMCVYVVEVPASRGGSQSSYLSTSWCVYGCINIPAIPCPIHTRLGPMQMRWG